jgi:hypothetical protein
LPEPSGLKAREYVGLSQQLNHGTDLGLCLKRDKEAFLSVMGK